MKYSIEDILKIESEAILNIPMFNFEHVVDRIMIDCHKYNGKLVISGMGKCGQIGHNIATTFCSTGTPAVFLHPSEAQHGDLGILQRNDVLLLLSNSGKTQELLELYDLKNALFNTVPTILITSYPDTFLAQVVDCCISTGNPKEVCPLGLTPTTSTTVMSVIGDILITQVMQQIGFTKEDYAKRHHGGYLGKKSKK